MDKGFQNKGLVILILLLPGVCWATLGDIEVINDLDVGNDATIVGIMQAEHLYSTDDLQVDDDATVGDLVVNTNLIKTVSATSRIGFNVTNPTCSFDFLGTALFTGPAGTGAGNAPTAFTFLGGKGGDTALGGPISIKAGQGGEGDEEYDGGTGGILTLGGGDSGADGGHGEGVLGYVNFVTPATFTEDVTLSTSDLLVPSGSRILLTQATESDVVIGSYGNRGSYFEGQTANNALTHDYFTKSGDGGDSCWARMWGVGTLGSQTNSESLLIGYVGASTEFRIWSLASGTGDVRSIKIYTGANTDQFTLLATGYNTMGNRLRIGSAVSPACTLDVTGTTAISGNLTVDGRTGLGIAVDSKYRLNVYDDGTATDHRYGGYFNVELENAAPASKILAGSYSLAETTHSSGTALDIIGAGGEAQQNSGQSVTNLYGVKALASSSALGTTTNAYGLYAGISRPGAYCGPITNAYGLYSIIDGGAAACTLIDNAYGLYIPAPINTGWISNYHSIYSVSGDNYFGGDMETAGTLTADTFTDGTASLVGGSLTSVKLGTLTDNGFVITSGDDGTLSVDTSTYIGDITGESIDDLSDVNDTDKADGRILKYDSGSGKMEYVEDLASGDLDGITDVTITNVAAGEVLTYDAGGDWINETLTQAGILAIDGSNANTTVNLAFQDFTTTGTVTTGPLSVGGSISTDLVPSIAAGKELGSSTHKWDVYGRNVYANVVRPSSVLQDLSIYTADHTTQLVLKRETGNIEMSGNLAVAGTVDGVDVAALKTDIDGFPDDLKNVTSTAAELNLLDGVTSTTAELNILDDVTSTAAELNILDGVTSTTAELNILDGVTSTAAELNILDGGIGNTVFVRPGDDIAAKYAWLKSGDRDAVMGAASATNRRLLILSPGKYTLAAKLTFDTDYVDFASLAGEKGSVIIGCAAGLTTNILSQTADDIRLTNLTFVDERTSDPTDYWDINCTDNTNSHYYKVKIITQDGTFLRFAIYGTSDIAGTWEFCEAGYGAWMAASNKELKAIMRHCIGGKKAFGGDQAGATITGRFEYCIAQEESFGGCGGTGIDNAGIHIGCIAGENSYGLNKEFSGIAIDCIGGDTCFGKDFTGLAINCIAGKNSFGTTNAGTQTGQIINCRSGSRANYTLGILSHSATTTTVSYAKTDASVTTSLTGENNDLVYTDKLNLYEGCRSGVKYIGDSGSGITLSVESSYDSICEKLPPLKKSLLVVHFESASPPTATQVKTVIDAHILFKSYFTISNAGGNDGSGAITAMDTLWLTGGKSGARFQGNHPWRPSDCTESLQVLDFDNGHTYQNTGAEAAVTFTLPNANVGLKYTFVRTEAGATKDVLVDPKAADAIVQMDGTDLGNGKYYGNTADAYGEITVECRVANKWQVTNELGTWVGE